MLTDRIYHDAAFASIFVLPMLVALAFLSYHRQRPGRRNALILWLLAYIASGVIVPILFNIGRIAGAPDDILGQLFSLIAFVSIVQAGLIFGLGLGKTFFLLWQDARNGK